MNRCVLLALLALMAGQACLAQSVASPNILVASYANSERILADPAGAVGPAQLIVAINGRLRSLNKLSGLADAALEASTEDFFASVLTPSASNSTFATRIRFDRLSGRWILLVTDAPGLAGSQANRVLIAVSSAAVVTGMADFSFAQFQLTATQFTDSASLGIDAHALYIGANLLDFSGNYQSSAVAVVNKAALLSTATLQVTRFLDIGSMSKAGPFAPVGVDNDDSQAQVGYVIGVDTQRLGQLDVIKVINPGGSPQLSALHRVIVAPTALPINVAHLGNLNSSAGELNTLDDRLGAAQMRAGRLWTVHHIGSNAQGIAAASASRNALRWYALDGLDGVPQVQQMGTIVDSGQGALSYWNSSVRVSGQGHALFGFSSAGAETRINAGIAARLSSDAPGAMSLAAQTYTQATAAYNPPADPGGLNGRVWGTSSSTSLDPCDDMTLWTFQQYVNASNSWGVRAVRVLAPAPSLLSCSSPISIERGQSNVTIQLSGSGLFDTQPSVGACRVAGLASTSGGGLLIERSTYNSPSAVTLRLQATSTATLGLRTLGWRNPDGQQAQADGCVHVVSDALFVNGFEQL